MHQEKPTLTPLPCPFCGEMPVVGPQDPKKDGNAWGYVSCESAWCVVLPDVRDGEECSDDRGTGAYIDCAIRRWNKRA